MEIIAPSIGKGSLSQYDNLEDLSDNIEGESIPTLIASVQESEIGETIEKLWFKMDLDSAVMFLFTSNVINMNILPIPYNLSAREIIIYRPYATVKKERGIRYTHTSMLMVSGHWHDKIIGTEIPSVFVDVGNKITKENIIPRGLISLIIHATMYRAVTTINCCAGIVPQVCEECRVPWKGYAKSNTDLQTLLKKLKEPVTRDMFRDAGHVVGLTD